MLRSKDASQAFKTLLTEQEALALHTREFLNLVPDLGNADAVALLECLKALVLPTKRESSRLLNAAFHSPLAARILHKMKDNKNIDAATHHNISWAISQFAAAMHHSI